MNAASGWAWPSRRHTDRLVVGLAFALLVPAFVYLTNVKSSETATVEQLVQPAQAHRIRRLRRLFGAQSDLSLLSVSTTRGKLSPARIEVLEQVVSKTPGVAHVWSPVSRPRLILTDPEMQVKLSRGPPPAAAANELDGFLRPDAHTALYVVTLDERSESLSALRETLSGLEHRVEQLLSPREVVRVVGLPAQRVESWKQVRKDVAWTVPLLALAAFTVPWLLFRSLWAAVFPVVLGGLATCTTLLTYRLLVGDLKPWVIVLVPLVWAVATMDTMHLYEGMQKRRLSGDADPVAGAARELSAPCLVTVLITAVSLLTLAAPGGPPLLQVFGIWGAVGSLFAYLLSFAVGVPLLRLASRAQKSKRGSAFPGLKVDRLARRVLCICQRHAPLVTLLWIILVTGAALTLPKLRGESSYNEPFVRSHPFSQDLHAFRAKTGSDLVPLEIYLEADPSQKNPARSLLFGTIALNEYLKTLPDTRLTLSVATLASELLRTDPHARSLQRRFRDPEAFGKQLRKVVHDARLRPWVDRDLDVTRTVLLLKPTSFERRAELIRFIDHFGKTMLKGRELSFGGVGYLYQTAEADGRTAILWGMGGDIALLIAALALALRRTRVVVAGVLGNLAPIVLLAGIMAVAGVPWSLGLLGLPIIVLGLAADDTIHVLWKARRKDLGLPTALSLAYRRFGSAVVGTSLLVSASLATLLVSDFQASRQLGWLFPAGILLALAAELTLVPALVGLRLRRLRVGFPRRR